MADKLKVPKNSSGNYEKFVELANDLNEDYHKATNKNSSSAKVRARRALKTIRNLCSELKRELT